METKSAEDLNDKALRGMLISLHADVKELLAVDYDQVQWQVVCEAASLADTIVQIINPVVETE